MAFSAFDVIGPAMIGPSSSHTAGAVRIGLVARGLLGEAMSQAAVELHGSFAATGKGHATDKAIVSGLLGFAPDDARLKESLTLARACGMNVTFSKVDLGEDVHPNTTRIVLEATSGGALTLVGSSIGGGTVSIVGIDNYPTSFGGELDTLVLWHRDSPGFLAKVTAVLACVEANIASIRTSRHGRGADALTVLEVDAPLPQECLGLLAKLPATARMRVLPKLP